MFYIKGQRVYRQYLPPKLIYNSDELKLVNHYRRLFSFSLNFPQEIKRQHTHTLILNVLLLCAILIVYASPILNTGSCTLSLLDCNGGLTLFDRVLFSIGSLSKLILHLRRFHFPHQRLVV